MQRFEAHVAPLDARSDATCATSAERAQGATFVPCTPSREDQRVGAELQRRRRTRCAGVRRERGSDVVTTSRADGVFSCDGGWALQFRPRWPRLRVTTETCGAGSPRRRTPSPRAVLVN